MAELHYGRGYVYSLQFHIVFCTKYRQPVLTGAVDQTLQETLRNIAIDNGVDIVAMESDEDHIHLLIELKPQHYIPDVIKALKGVSARLLFQKHPELKKTLWDGNLWNPSYFISSVSENTESQIKEYILSQKSKKR